MLQPLRELPWMGRVENGESVDHLRVVHRDGPGDRTAPVVADQERRLRTKLSDEAADVGGEQIDAIRLEAVWLRRQVVASRVGGDYPKTGRRRAARSVAANRTRTPGNRATEQSEARHRPRRNAGSRRQLRHTPPEAQSRRQGAGWWWSWGPPWVGNFGETTPAGGDTQQGHQPPALPNTQADRVISRALRRV